MIDWISRNSTAITAWCMAVSTFAVYSVLYRENRFYRLFEHIFIGLAAGYGVYMTWSQVLAPKWWDPIVKEGHWYWAFAAVVGSMFYFIYSKRSMWISRIVFGMLMGLAAGGMFREFYEIYFPQIGSSMKPLAGPEMTVGSTVTVVVFYAVLLCSMVYFFFSFEHKHPAVTRTAAAGRWFLMIGFGAIFGATVMGRMTLFIGRFNHLVTKWVPEVKVAWSYTLFRLGVILAALAVAALIFLLVSRRSRRAGTGS